MAEEVEVALLELHPGKTVAEEVAEEEKQLKRAMEASLNPEEDCDPFAQATRVSKRQRPGETLEDKVWEMELPDRLAYFAMQK